MAEKTSKLEIIFKRNRAFDLNQRYYQAGVRSSQRNTESISNWGNKQLDSSPQNMLWFRFLRLQKDLSFAKRALLTFWRENTGCETPLSLSGPRVHVSEDTSSCPGWRVTKARRLAAASNDTHTKSWKPCAVVSSLPSSMLCAL